jgi:hypothetical protein
VRQSPAVVSVAVADKNAYKNENTDVTVGTKSFVFYGGAERDRTVDLLNAIQALSQLSYGPTFKEDWRSR